MSDKSLKLDNNLETLISTVITDADTFTENKLKTLNFQTNSVQSRFSHNFYWKDFSWFAYVEYKPEVAKSLSIVENLDKYLNNFNEHINKKYSNDNINAFFTVLEYIFSTLSLDSQTATLPKIISSINSQIDYITNDYGKFTPYNIKKIKHYTLQIEEETTKNHVILLLEQFYDKFLFNDKYSQIFEQLKIHNTPQTVSSIVQASLYNFPLNIPQKTIELLFSDEEIHLKNIKISDNTFKNNYTLNYLLEKFKGWDSPEYLSLFFEHAHLNEKNLFQLKQNIQHIPLKASGDILEKILYRTNIQSKQKINIISMFFKDVSKDSNIFDFIYSSLKNEELHFSDFENDPFNLKQIIYHKFNNLNNFVKFYNKIEFLLSSNKMKKDNIPDLSYLVKNLNANNIEQVDIKVLIKIVKTFDDSFTSDDKTKIINSLFDYTFVSKKPIQNIYFITLLSLWKNDIDIENFVSYNKEKISKFGLNYSFANDYKTNYNSIKVINQDSFQELLFNETYKHNSLNFSLATFTPCSEWFSHVIKYGKTWDYYDKFFNYNSIATHQTELNRYFHQNHNEWEKFKNQINCFKFFINCINEYKPDCEINLKEKNPLIEKLNDIIYTSKKIFPNKTYIEEHIESLKDSLKVLIFEIFENKISLYSFENKSLKDCLKELDESINGINNFSNILPENKSTNKKLSFLNIFNKPKNEVIPYFLSIKDRQLTLEHTSTYSSDLIEKAQKDCSEIKKYLDSVSHKPFNIEVLLKTNNLIIDYLDFINLIDGYKDNLDKEDMHFLESNISSYLLGSLQSYSKSVSKYELMQKNQEDSNLKVPFSLENEQYIENFKVKADNECIRWIELLNEQLQVVKKNIVVQLQEHSIHDMKVRTKFFMNKFSLNKDNEDSVKAGIVKIK